MTVTEFFKEKVSFFSGLSDEEAHELAEASEQLTFKPGHSIIMQGMTVDGLHVIAEGKVSVWIKPQGKPSVQVATLGPGEVFGERSIVELGLAGATIKALEETLVFMVRQDAFLKLIAAKPALLDYIKNQIAERRKALVNNPKAEQPPKAP